MKIFKRLTVVVLSVILLLNGCALQNALVVSETETGGEVSRAQYVKMIYDGTNLNKSLSSTPFYSDVNKNNEFFNEIQSCYEWGYIEQTNDDKTFHPENSATNGFAVITAVKAIGIDIINASGYSLKNNNDYVQFFYMNSDLNLDNDGLLTNENAKKIISLIGEIKNSLTLNDKYSVSYADNVYQIAANSVNFANDGKSAVLSNSKSLKAGDYLVIDDSNEFYSGRAIKIKSIKNNTIEYENAELSDVVTDVFVTGEAAPKIVNWECDDKDVSIKEIDIEDVNFDKDEKIEVVPLGTPNEYNISNTDHKKSINIGDKAFEIVLKTEKNCKATIKLALTNMTGKIYLDANIAKFDIKRLQFSFSSVAKFQTSISGDFKSLKIPTSKSPVRLRFEASFFKIIGIGINFKIKLNIGGSISISYSVEQSSMIDYKKHASPKYIPSLKCNDSKVDIKAKASLTGDLSVSPDLLEKPITDVGIELGIEATAQINEYACLDINAYMIARGYVGSEDSLSKDLGLSFKRELITKENSPFNITYHIEDGKVVKKCTMKGSANNALLKKLTGKKWYTQQFQNSYDGEFAFVFYNNGTGFYADGISEENTEFELSYKIVNDNKIVNNYFDGVNKLTDTLENIGNSNLVKATSKNNYSTILSPYDPFTQDNFLNALYNNSNIPLRWESEYLSKKISGFKYISCNDGTKLTLETDDQSIDLETYPRGENLIYCVFNFEGEEYDLFVEKYSNSINAFIKRNDENGLTIERWQNYKK